MGSMTNYALPDKEEPVVCPYDPVHVMPAGRMQRHLMKCAKNHPNSNLVICPFNFLHRIPKPERKRHMANCPDRVRVDSEIIYQQEKEHLHGNINVPAYDSWKLPDGEDWDSGDVWDIGESNEEPVPYMREGKTFHAQDWDFKQSNIKLNHNSKQSKPQLQGFQSNQEPVWLPEQEEWGQESWRQNEKTVSQEQEVWGQESWKQNGMATGKEQDMWGQKGWKQNNAATSQEHEGWGQENWRQNSTSGMKQQQTWVANSVASPASEWRDAKPLSKQPHQRLQGWSQQNGAAAQFKDNEEEMECWDDGWKPDTVTNTKPTLRLPQQEPQVLTMARKALQYSQQQQQLQQNNQQHPLSMAGIGRGLKLNKKEKVPVINGAFSALGRGRAVSLSDEEPTVGVKTEEKPQVNGPNTSNRKSRVGKGRGRGATIQQMTSEAEPGPGKQSSSEPPPSKEEAGIAARREMRKINKKLKEIESLEVKKAEGQELNDDQEEKIKRKPDLLNQLASLNIDDLID